MILKRMVKNFGRGSGHIAVPREMVGETVYIVTSNDALDLKELLERTLILRKVDEVEKKEFSRELEEFKREVRVRLTDLELVFQKLSPQK